MRTPRFRINLSKKSLIKGMSVLILPVYDGRPVFFYLILSDEKNVSSGTKKLWLSNVWKDLASAKHTVRFPVIS